MKMKILVAGLLGVVSSQLLVASAQANQLQNPGFESNPPSTGWGNHINHSISPWVLGGGDASNVIKVDGGSSYTPGNQGPHADASGASAGTVRHYLDIANGSNDFYQTFTAQCSGKVDFGGYFSTRGNASGGARVTLRKDAGFNGNVVGQTNQVNLAGGNSAKDPWTRVSYTANIVAGSVYSMVVSMGNNMNFDEAFVNFETDCNPGSPSGGVAVPSYPIDLVAGAVIALPDVAADPCCPPINKNVIPEQLTPIFQTNGGSGANYRLNFSATPQFNSQMQGYLNYVHTMKPAINALISTWRIYDKGASTSNNPPTSNGLGSMVGQFFTNFRTTQPPQHGNMAAGYPMQPNHWYRVQVGTYFNNNQRFFPKKCESSQYLVNWRFNKSAMQQGGNAGDLIVSDGRKVLASVKVMAKGKKLLKHSIPRKRLKQRKLKEFKRR